MRATVRHVVADQLQREVNDDLLAALNGLLRFVSWGDGAPAHSPAGPQIYFEQDGPGVHFWNGSWTELT